MYKQRIRNKILFYFISIISITIILIAIFTLQLFKNYSERNFASTILVHANHINNMLHDECPDVQKVDLLSTLIFNISDNMKLNIEIIDQKGKVIASSENINSSYNNATVSEITDAFNGIDSFSFRKDSTTNKNMLYTAVPFGINPPYQAVVRVSKSTESLDEEFYNLVKVVAVVFFVALILAVFVSIKLAKKLLHPLEKITASALKLSNGDLNERIHHKGDSEFSLLAHTLNGLANNLTLKIEETSNEKQKLELILEHMDNIVMLFDKAGRLNTINARGRYFFSNQVLNKHNLEFIGSVILDSALKKCIQTNQGTTIDLKLTINNNRYVFQVFISPLPDLQNQTINNILCVFHDITALQLVYEKQAEFIANASHELATPLTSIKGFSETLLDNSVADITTNRKFLTIIYQESERMQRLIKDLLKIARLQSTEHKQAIILSTFTAKEVLDSLADEVMLQLRRKKITTNIVYNNLQHDLIANKDWLKQALVNLLENAIKYSPENSTVTVTYDEQGDKALFSVSDQGCGIAPNNLPFIFERFYRVDKARTKKDDTGTGLGLSIVKFIIDLLGGRITVSSQLNIGTTFTFTIPLKK